jgi:conjugative transposon TraN protein
MNIKLKFLIALILYGIYVETNAQTLLEVTFNKTSSIIFPAAITAVDRGSRDILAQKVKGVENVLQVKASKTRFKDTNLTVITADGSLHQFTVRYTDIPAAFTVRADPNVADTRITFEQATTQVQLERSAVLILRGEKAKPVKSVSKNQMRMDLLGIYIQGNTMFYHLKVSNHSNIPYHTDLLRFYVRDKQRVKRTASQEVDEVPIFHKGNSAFIRGKTSEDIVFALPKFTIPDAKVLMIEIMEKNGGRHLQLAIRNKRIVKAKLIPSV